MTRALLSMAAILAWIVSANAQAPAPITLDELERLALASHPSLAAASATIDVARHAAAQAGSWPNPSVSYVGDEIARGPINRGGEHGVVVDQRIPLGGKLRLSRQAFEAGIGEAEAGRDRARLQVLAGVRVAYHMVVAAQLRLDVRRNLATLAAEAGRVSAQLFNVGAADRPDVLVAEMDASLAGLDVVEAESALARAWTQLAAAVAQPRMPQRAVAGAAGDALPELPRDETLAAALAASPELAEARAAVTRAERELAVARKVTSPDLLLKGGPRYNRELLEPDNRPVGLEWAVEAGLTIPLWDRNHGGIAASSSRIAAARAAVAALELKLIDRYAALYDDYRTARRRAEVYRSDILPKATEAYQLYLARHRAMAASYPQVLMTERALFEANERYLAALEQVRTTAVSLTALLAEP